MTEPLWRERFPSFGMEELLSPAGLECYARTGRIPLDFTAIDKLQAFRNHLGNAVKVNYAGMTHRGFRSHEENAAIDGSARMSPHCLGKAFDITVDNMTEEQVFAEAIKFGWRGVGIYDTWVHVDMMDHFKEGPVTWDKRTKK